MLELKSVLKCYDCNRRIGVKMRGRFQADLVIVCDSCYLERHLNS